MSSLKCRIVDITFRSSTRLLLLLAEFDLLELLLLPALVAVLDTRRIHDSSSRFSAAFRVLGGGDTLAAKDLVENLHTIRGDAGATDAVLVGLVLIGVLSDGRKERSRAFGTWGSVAGGKARLCFERFEEGPEFRIGECVGDEEDESGESDEHSRDAGHGVS